MLLKRQEKNGKIKAMYSSSTICASTYDTETKDLTVIFKNGGQYKYPNVEKTDYMRLEIAESNGSTFNTYIKKKYTNFQKLESVQEENLKMILNEIESLSTPTQEEKKTETVELDAEKCVNTLALFVTNYVANKSINKELLMAADVEIQALLKNLSK